jgi:hypothetical protein
MLEYRPRDRMVRWLVDQYNILREEEKAESRYARMSGSRYARRSRH